MRLTIRNMNNTEYNTEYNNKHRMNMKHTTILRNALTALLAAAALFAASCQEEKESPTRMILAVNDTTMNLSSKASQQHVLVYAKGSWNARLGENADWATLTRLTAGKR